MIIQKYKSAEKDESFSIELLNPNGGAKIGRTNKAVVTIINDDGTVYYIGSNLY